MPVVYRAFDKTGRLLYVGVADDIEKRMTQHRSGSGWIDLMTTLLIAPYPDRDEALAAEREAIKTEWPQWNVNGSPFASVSPRWRWERERYQQNSRTTPLTSREFDAFCRECRIREDRVGRIVDKALGRSREDLSDLIRRLEASLPVDA